MKNTECCNQDCNQGRTCPLRHRDCQRSHPHEEMTPMCELRTEIARLTNKLAHTEAQFAAVQQGVQPAEAVPEGFGTAQHWKEKAQYWANVAHELRGQALRGEPVDGITHPTQQGLDALTPAARSVIAERARQIAAEGYTPEQDDGYNPGVLALHGGLYACHAFDNLTKKRAPEGWQWDEKWWKPKDPRSNLVKAGALVLAEIERIDRVCAAQAKQGEQANG